MATIGVLAPRLTTRHHRACSIAPNSSRGRSCSSCGGQASTTVRTWSPCTGIRSVTEHPAEGAGDEVLVEHPEVAALPAVTHLVQHGHDAPR